MTDPERKTEHRYVVQERLGIDGYTQSEIPTAEHHNLAVEEAEAHIERIRKTERSEIQEQFELLRKAI